MRTLRGINHLMLRPIHAKSWLAWIAISVAYFFIGINLGSGVFDHQIIAGLLSVAIAVFVLWVCYRYLEK